MKYTVQPSHRLFNRYLSGYLQSGKNYLDFDTVGRLSVPKTVHDQGITGSGQIINVVDSGLDIFHDFFYDPQYTGTIYGFQETNNHRKLIRYDPYGDIRDSVGGHGTHVCGTAAGKAQKDSTTDSQYNGVAPDAKIYFVDLSSYSNEDSLYLDASQNLTATYEEMTKLDSGVSSNSWGASEHVLEETMMYDYYAYQNPNILTVFAAGNDPGEFKVKSPADSKNVLTVGMVTQPSVQDVEQANSRYFVLTDGQKEVRITSVGTNSVSLFATGNTYTSFHDLIVSSNDVSVSSGSDVCSDLNTAASNNAKLFISSQSANSCSNSQLNGMAIVTVSSDSLATVNSFTKVSIVAKSSSTRKIESDYRSSQGPCENGITKPEIAAMGINVTSAKARGPNSMPSSDTSMNTLLLNSGTSMATPAISGLAVLVRDFFVKGKYKGKTMTPSASLMKATLINCATAIDAKYMQSYISGFGIPQLDSGLGFGSTGVYFIDNVKISHDDAHVYTITTDKDGDLSITMSYIDVPITTDDFVLYADISIFLESGDQFWTGNGLSGNAQERLSTTEKIIVKNAKAGTYTLHVYSDHFTDETISENPTSVNYALAVSGGFTTGDNKAVVKVATKAPKACKGTISGSTCVCSSSQYGYFCQESVASANTDTQVMMTVSPRVYKHFSMTLSAGVNYTFSVKTPKTTYTRFVITEEGGLPSAVRLAGTGIAGYYATSRAVKVLISAVSYSQSDQEIGMGFFPPGSQNTFKSEEGDPSKPLSGGVIAGIVIAVVVVIGAVIGGIVYFIKR